MREIINLVKLALFPAVSLLNQRKILTIMIAPPRGTFMYPVENSQQETENISSAAIKTRMSAERRALLFMRTLATMNV